MECELQEKKTKHIHASAADLLHFRIGNLDWCKYGLCKNKAREIDCLCCREVNAMLMILWVTARLLITSVCLVKLNEMSTLDESKVLPFSFWF